MFLWVQIALAIALVLVRKWVKSPKLKLPPGPPNWPIVGALFYMEPRFHQAFARLAMKYGPIVHFRLGVHNVVICSSVGTCEEVLKQKDLIFASRPNSTIQFSAAKYLGFECSDLGFADWKPPLKFLRKVCVQEFFTHAKLKTFEKVRKLEVEMMITDVRRKGEGGRTVNIRKSLVETTTHHICTLLYNRGFSEATLSVTEDLKSFHQITEDFGQLVMRFNICDLFPVLEGWDPQGILALYKNFNKRATELFGKVLDEHRKARQSDENYKDEDFVDLLLTHQEQGRLSENAIMGTLLDMMSAGIDTSATCTEWALIELNKKPELLKRLQDEVDAVVGRDRQVEETDFPNMVYLQAVCQETFRLHSPVPLLEPHFNYCPTTIGDFDIPAKTAVFINTYSIGRDPCIWDSPLDFRPERFLGPDKEVAINGTDFRLLPFGSGRRMCVGMNLGMLIFKRLLTSLVHAFDWTTPPGMTISDLSTVEGSGSVVRSETPLMLVPVPRLPSDVYHFSSSDATSQLTSG